MGPAWLYTLNRTGPESQHPGAEAVSSVLQEGHLVVPRPPPSRVAKGQAGFTSGL